MDDEFYQDITTVPRLAAVREIYALLVVLFISFVPFV
jgi:hypothetical protein